MWPLSEDRFRELLGQVDAVFYADTHEPVPAPLYLSANADQVLGPGARQANLEDPDLWWRTIHRDDVDRVMEVWSQAYRSLEPYRVDYRYVRPDGEGIWLRDHAAPVRDDDGTVMHWQGVLLDVTEERDAHEALVRSEERHRRMLEGLPALVYVVTDEDEFTILDTSVDGALLLGFDPKDERWARMIWLDIVHPDDRSAMIAAWRHARVTGEPFDEEYRQVDAAGEVLWVHDHAVLVRDGEGRRLHWQGMVIDVTARVAAERVAREAQHRFATIEGQLPIIVYAVTDELSPAVLYCSPNTEDVVGVSAAAFLAGTASFPDFLHPDDRAAADAAWVGAWRERRRYDAEYRVPLADGSTVWIRDTAERVRAPGGELAFWQGVMLDVTEERLAHAELEASEASRRALIENLPAIVYEMAHDDDRRTLYISAGIEALLGYTHREWLEQPDIWAELLHPDDRENELAAHDEASRTGEPWSREYRLVAADGRVVWVRDVSRLVPGIEGSTWQGVFVDVTATKLTEETLRLVRDDLEQRVTTRTADLAEANALLELEVGERRRAEREARTAEERFRRLVEDLPAVVYRWDLPESIVSGHEYVSPGIGPLLGYSAKEWRTDHLWQERLHPHDRDRVVAAVALSEATGETFDEEYRYLAKDGRVVWVHDRATLIARDADGAPSQFQGVLIEITERKTAEQLAAEAEARFREVIERGPVITYSYRMTSYDPPEVHVDYMSPEMGVLLGYPLDQLGDDQQRWFALMHPDDIAATVASMAAAWATGAPWDARFRMIRSDGEIVAFRSRGRCVERDGLGRPWRFVGAITDETQERIAAATRAEILARHRDVIETLGAIVWTERQDAPDVPPRYTYISPESVGLLGYAPEELIEERHHFPRLIHPDDVATTLEADRRADVDPDGVWDVVYRVVRRDGAVRTVHSIGRRATRLGVYPVVWHGVTIDVSHRRVAVPMVPTFDAATDPRSAPA